MISVICLKFIAELQNPLFLCLLQLDDTLINRVFKVQ